MRELSYPIIMVPRSHVSPIHMWGLGYKPLSHISSKSFRLCIDAASDFEQFCTLLPPIIMILSDKAYILLSRNSEPPPHVAVKSIKDDPSQELYKLVKWPFKYCR